MSTGSLLNLISNDVLGDPMRVLIGINSFIPLRCETGLPVVYTRISSHIDWILKVIKENT